MVQNSNPFVNRYSNLKMLDEKDFNITPPGLYIWPGEFPFKRGDTFPTDEIKTRASEYLTNKMLYKNKFNNIMDNVFSWADYWQNPVTNSPNMAIIADLPDFNTTTESWVELIAAKPPRLISAIEDTSNARYSEANDNIAHLANVVQNSNFAIELQDIIRCAYCMFGNKVVRVNKLENGAVNIVNMPLKCWIPWVNNADITSIEVNMFFSIFENGDGNKVCQFICYYENGTIEKRTFAWSNDTLGDEIGEVETTKAFDGSDISPIVVFTGDRSEGAIFGNSQFKYWDASISFAIRAYEALGVLIEQMKEIYRVLPDGTTRTDEDSGITYQVNTGSIAYKSENAPEVKIAKVQLQLDQALSTYDMALKRVAKDTGLPLSYFDESVLKGRISADALRTSMFRSELKAEKIISLFKNDSKKLIVRIAKAIGIDINISDFELGFKTGFINDEELQMKIIQARSGNAVTMSVADAIAAYDEISPVQAKKKADELAGIKIESNETPAIENSTSGSESTVDNGVNFDHVSQEVEYDKPIIESPIGLI